MQNGDGGFGFWKRGDESWPYLSIHAAHALALAKQKKLDVPADMIEKSRKYLRGIESHIPSRYGADASRALRAYALYVRVQMGDRDVARARKLMGESRLENLSLESVGWLLSVLSGDPASQTQVAQLRLPRLRILFLRTKTKTICYSTQIVALTALFSKR
jgi:uncharacterized protein YfaS (alpha-2-macroglobulin family)